MYSNTNTEITIIQCGKEDGTGHRTPSSANERAQISHREITANAPTQSTILFTQ